MWKNWVPFWGVLLLGVSIVGCGNAKVEPNVEDKPEGGDPALEQVDDGTGQDDKPPGAI
ncbi:MAG: hypothetical protein KDA80_21695 [Planctomycetaceae bacterium]|nr:hypothetical protein [Planctomycetaceae bacterium]